MKADGDPRRWWALGAMGLAVFPVAVDGTVLSLAAEHLCARPAAHRLAGPVDR